MIPTYRVSAIAAYARWKADEDADSFWLERAIFANQQSDAMARGTAFHKALELACEGLYDTVEADGYTFAFTCDAEISLPKKREMRLSKNYGGIIVSGACDGIEGRAIIDHKTVSQFDAEYHFAGWQHRFYMDIFGADRFDWHIWVVSNKTVECECPSYYAKEEAALGGFCPVHGLPEYRKEGRIEVREHHLLTQYRYPGLEEDCTKMAHEFRDFAAWQGWKGKAA